MAWIYIFIWVAMVCSQRLTGERGCYICLILCDPINHGQMRFHLRAL